MIKFITLYPEAKNIELIKPVGQIPYYLNKKNNIDASLVTSGIDPNGEYVSEVEGLKLLHLPILFKCFAFSGLMYILMNARKIDWLHLFHAGRRSYYWIKAYKLLNPKGRVYLNLDLDFVSCNKYDLDQKERELFFKNTCCADLISCESNAVKERIEKYSNKKIIIVSHGFSNNIEETEKTCQKENMFLTVGRLGTKQKATDILLEAYAKSSKEHDWSLKLIGSIEKKFRGYIDNFFNMNPELRDRIEFVGEINDRCELYNEYKKAKVFVLASRWESFGIVCAEALSCGCRLIISDQIPPKLEFTNEGKYGQIVPIEDPNILSEIMIKETKRVCELTESEEISNYAQELFAWKKIVDGLYYYLQKIE